MKSLLFPFSRRFQVAAAVLSGAVALMSSAHASSVEDWQRLKAMSPRGYLIGKTAMPVTVDGKLDDPAWAAAPWTDAFEDIEGPVRPKPKYRTRAKMIWDDRYLYIAAELEEPHVWGTLKDHDSVIFRDNDFEFFIEPDGDNHNYYEFEMNALNTTWDLLLVKPYKDGGPALNEFELHGLKSAVHVDGTLNDPRDTDRGWTLEIAIPWAALRQKTSQNCPPKNGDFWRIGFSRVEWQINIVDGKYEKVPGTKEDNWVWSPQGIVDMHRPERWGVAQFTEQAPGSGSFQNDPTLAVRDALHEIYYHQRDFHGTHQRYADSLQELGMQAPAFPGQKGNPVIKPRGKGYEAVVERDSGGRVEVWKIREDAKVTHGKR